MKKLIKTETFLDGSGNDVEIPICLENKEVMSSNGLPFYNNILVPFSTTSYSTDTSSPHCTQGPVVAQLNPLMNNGLVLTSNSDDVFTETINTTTNVLESSIFQDFIGWLDSSVSITNSAAVSLNFSTPPDNLKNLGVNTVNNINEKIRYVYSNNPPNMSDYEDTETWNVSYDSVSDVFTLQNQASGRNLKFKNSLQDCNEIRMSDFWCGGGNNKWLTVRWSDTAQSTGLDDSMPATVRFLNPLNLAPSIGTGVSGDSPAPEPIEWEGNSYNVTNKAVVPNIGTVYIAYVNTCNDNISSEKVFIEARCNVTTTLYPTTDLPMLLPAGKSNESIMKTDSNGRVFAVSNKLELK